MTSKEALTIYGTDAATGLSTASSQERLKIYGPNLLKSHKHRSELLELIQHFKSPLVIILLVAAIVSYSVGETINASIIFGM